MSNASSRTAGGFGGYRIKLMVVMMLMVSAVTGAGLYFAEHNLSASVTSGLQREFIAELGGLHGIQELRQANFAEVCRDLVRKPRIHAALEDNALDLLYPIAKDELRDLMNSASAGTDSEFGAIFYRFLDFQGRVITPRDSHGAGHLLPEEEAQLSLRELPHGHQTGYLFRHTSNTADPASVSLADVAEVITTPIISTESGEPIAAMAIGFKPVEPGNKSANRRIRSGIWMGDRLHLATLSTGAQSLLSDILARTLANPGSEDRATPVSIDGTAHLLFHKQLNPGSMFPPAHEICLYPLADLLARQRKLRWSFAGGGGLVLFGGLIASGFFSARLSAPVEKLAVDSEEHRAQRNRAETALELTHEGLQRAIRFSADASHQLKTPVTVLRAGLEEILSRESVPLEVRDELGDLVHQTYRLTSVIDDLLLLSRVDAGRLQLHKGPVDLSQLLEAGLDDLGAVPESDDFAVEAEVPPNLTIEGESRYTSIILQNLLENARKYNQPGGRIRIVARTEDDRVSVRIGNTGRTIPTEMQDQIFERFHRGSVGENVPGHGLGLNLARELARLHGGELRLVMSDSNWTEFEACFTRVSDSFSLKVKA